MNGFGSRFPTAAASATSPPVLIRPPRISPTALCGWQFTCSAYIGIYVTLSERNATNYEEMLKCLLLSRLRSGNLRHEVQSCKDGQRGMFLSISSCHLHHFSRYIPVLLHIGRLRFPSSPCTICGQTSPDPVPLRRPQIDQL